MSKDVWYCTRMQGDDEIVIMLKRWGLPKNWKSLSYYDYASYNSHCNKLEADIVTTIQKLRKQILQYVEADTMRRADVKVAKQNSFGMFGISDPQKVPMKDLVCYGKYCPKPDSSVYREALNPQWLKKLGLSTKPRRTTTEGRTQRPRSRGETTVYVGTDAQTAKEYNIEIIGGQEVDNIVPYKETKSSASGNNNSKTSKKEWKKKWRQENPLDGGESHQEWNDRADQAYNEDQGS